MRVCIQDPRNNSVYLINEAELAKFAADGEDEEKAIDVLLVHPGNTLIQELPPTRMSDSTTPTVQIVDPDGNRNWVIEFDDLKRYTVPVPPSDAEDVIWFAMPSAKETLAAVPVFRRALVQHSSGGAE
jgi:hypothetical protein